MTMALIKENKSIEKSYIKISTSKVLADEFNNQLDIYNKNNSSSSTLDFDNLVKKLIKELSEINKPFNIKK